ncbi:hypothetical protein [Actinoplanes sp. NPDC049118]|uniref:hypothetical protein n=1 Tax=Actinoplanes sp. NPDC049118 TaxID=3155769 RepID=UPI0033FCBE95
MVTIPSTPVEGDGYFWSEVYDSGRVDLSDFPNAASATACMKKNSAVLKGLLSDDAELLPELARSKTVLRL